MSTKKMMSVCIVAIMLFSLVAAGCSNTTVTTTSTTTTSATTTTTSQTQQTSTPDPGVNLMTKKADGQTITTWTWDQPEFNKKIEDYIKSAAGVTIDGQTMGFGDIMTKLTAAAAAGTGMPDAFKAGGNQLPKLVEINAVKDITDLVQPYLHLLPDVAWEMVTYNGKIWGIPANSPAGGIFYRYDVCKKYGVDPKEIKTWDQFIEAGKKIMSGSNGEVAMINAAFGQIGWPIDSAIFQQNRAELISSDKKVTVNSESFRNSLELLKKISDAQISVDISDWEAPWYDAIKDGSIAAFASGTWFRQIIVQQTPDQEGIWYFTPFPAISAGGDRYPNYGSALVCMSSQTEKVDAAFEWMKAWALDKEGSVDIGLKELGISVISYTALEDEFVQSPDPLFAENQAYWKEATEAFTKSEYIPPMLMEYDEAQSIWAEWYEQWWLGKASIDKILTESEKEMKEKLKLD
jgi:lactose/L-arabinose transport system substrate-binding protein